MQKHRLIALGIGLSAVLAACSSSGASTAPSAAPSAAPAASPSAPAAAGTTIALADSSLGKILVDGKGMTLYMFTPDDGQAVPTCNDKCAATWPPLIADGTPTLGAGLAAAIASVARADGSMQVKYGDYPLYTFAADKAPGDVNGQNVGPGKWFVVGADGEPIKQ
jgi:predicted lipoprotein with Yx(FWY)xxD motif